MRRFLARFLWPGLLALALTGTAIGIGRSIPPVPMLAIGYLCFAILIGFIERVFPHNPEWNKRDGQLRNDLGHTILGSIIAPRIADGIVLAALAAPQMWLAGFYGNGVWPIQWPLFFQVVLAIFLGDLGGYWAHRLSHKVPFLWRFHALHHSPSRLYFINTGRFHPIDTIESVLLISPVLILLGASADVLFWQIAFTNYVGILSHCNIEMRPGFLNYLFNTPGVHRWHHSHIPDEANNNYGENIMIFDHLFRTHLNPDRPPPEELGIKAAMPEDFLGQLLSPLNFHKLEEQGRAMRGKE